jgi:hypothetical protein
MSLRSSDAFTTVKTRAGGQFRQAWENDRLTSTRAEETPVTPSARQPTARPSPTAVSWVAFVIELLATPAWTVMSEFGEPRPGPGQRDMPNR